MTDRETFDVVAEVRVLQARLKDFMVTTTEYRQELGKKIDELTVKINALPCPDRKGKYESLTKQVGILWGLTVAIVIVIVTKFIEQ